MTASAKQATLARTVHRCVDACITIAMPEVASNQPVQSRPRSGKCRPTHSNGAATTRAGQQATSRALVHGRRTTERPVAAATAAAKASTGIVPSATARTHAKLTATSPGPGRATCSP